MLDVRVYRDGTHEDRRITVDEVAGLVAHEGTTAWISMRADHREEVDRLLPQLGVHHLAVEDVLTEHQRPKLEHYADHLFLDAYAVSLVDRAGRMADLAVTEVSAIIHPRAVIVVAENDGFDRDEVFARIDDGGDLTQGSVWGLVYALLDSLVDGHLTAAEALDEAADGLGDVLFAEDAGESTSSRSRSRPIQRDAFELHTTLAKLRRVVVPMREVAGILLRHQQEAAFGGKDELGALTPGRGGTATANHSTGAGTSSADTSSAGKPADDGSAGKPADDGDARRRRGELAPYFQDVNDHVLRAIEWTESSRDMVATVLQTHLTMQGNTLNVVMKKLTGWAAIIAVPTLITGFYGMNVPYPGTDTGAGVVVACALILVCSGVLWWQFRRRGWL